MMVVALLLSRRVMLWNINLSDSRRQTLEVKRSAASDLFVEPLS